MSTGYAMAEEAQPIGYKEEAQQKKKVKKIGFFKRWMLKSVKEAVDAERRNEANVIGTPDIISARQMKIGRQEASIDQPDRAIQFTVYTANGGRVVETRRYDRKTDRHANNLYVVTSEQDFGREIDKIITLEALR